jgi:DNA repair protein SbcC/Rad50
LADMSRALLEKTAAHGFDTLDAIRAILALLHSRERLLSQITALQRQMQQSAAQINDCQAQLMAEQALALTTLTPQEVDAQLRDVAGKMDIAAEEIRHMEEILHEQLKLRGVQAELQDKLDRRQQQYDAYQNDLQQAGNAAFRRRVQKHMADNLLFKTNEYLQKISGRYLLHQIESEYGLALAIEDAYQQNVRRLPKSLSGGESFVVSLALSLGLSELANNGNSVDSLFLDEGFGNLDREVLELVVNTLKDLRKHGKTVGVISHVKRVEELIDTKILMSKRLDGISELAIAS